MYLKIIPLRSAGSNTRMLECRRWVLRRPTEVEISDEFVSSFDVNVAEGDGELEHNHVVILRLDWGTDQAQSIVFTSPANVFVMSDTGQTVDRFGIN